ncbi:MAG: methyltransferase domain-containing protein [Candidatus Bathyarchaeota archaeon]|nr:MAG: methyltransferase domain-containing protein [Candidatus Bathyarchaeota archaeon]
MSSGSRKYAYGGKAEEAMRLEAQAKAFEKVIARELEILNLKPKMKVLDAGCGTGVITRRIASRVYPEEVCAIDFDPLFIKEAKKLATRDGIENAKFEVGDIHNLKFNNAEFDLSYCRLVLMHVRDPVTTIAELKRVTKSGGFVAASDVDDGTVLTFPQTPKLLELWSKFGQNAKTRGDDRYIGRQLFSIFSQAGLRSISIHPIPFLATQQELEELKMFVSVPIQIMLQDRDAMMEAGLATSGDFDEAIREAQLVTKDPGAFMMCVFFLALGKVP